MRGARADGATTNDLGVALTVGSGGLADYQHPLHLERLQEGQGRGRG